MHETFFRPVSALALTAAGATLMLLAGCTADPPVQPPGSASVGETTSCPGEFLHSLANQRTAAGAGVEVVEDASSTEFDEIDIDGFACVAKLSGNRTLPSGAPEPDEFVALYEGERAESITAQVEALGFTPSERGIWRRDGELLSIRTEGAPRLGIEGDATYTLVSVMDSEELADIRVPR
jgi:hypothetical protein